MSCTVCGSNVSCGCARTGVLVDPFCAPNCNQSSCNTSVKTSPQPFYSCAPGCQESNTQQIITQEFDVCLNVVNSWNVPTCGNTATLNIPGLVSIAIGSYLWNAGFGYFEITSFDASTQTVVVENHCNTDNSAPGTNVPSCTCFLNAAPPPADVSPNTPCVAIDFTAPALNTPTDITLTTTTGIAAGDTVQIGSGFYLVTAVKPNNIITIENIGSGITPGTPVIARDSSGNYQYCLEILTQSPCERSPEGVGKIVICDSSGVQTTLIGAFPSDGNTYVVVPALNDGGDTDASYVAIDAGKLRCGILAVAATIATGTTVYTLVVQSNAAYNVGDLVQFPGSSLYFLINGIAGLSLTVTAIANPSGSITYPIGTALCVITCCESLQRQINVPVASSDYPGANLGGASLTSGSPSFTSGIKTFATMVNPSNQLSMTVIQNVYARWFADITTTAAISLILNVNLQLSIDGGSYNTVASRSIVYPHLGTSDTAPYSNLTEQVIAMGVPIIVAPSASTILAYKVFMSISSAAGTSATISDVVVLGSLVGAY